MPKVEIRVKGLRALQEQLKVKRDALLEELASVLKKLGEDAVRHAKERKGYKDHTANLKNSISYALYYDGKPVMMEIGKVSDAEAQADVSKNFQAYAEAHVQPQGYTLIVVAGMSYGRYVEDKGYNVLHLTRYFLQDELKKIVQETIEDVRNGNV